MSKVWLLNDPVKFFTQKDDPFVFKSLIDNVELIK